MAGPSEKEKIEALRKLRCETLDRAAEEARIACESPILRLRNLLLYQQMNRLGLRIDTIRSEIDRELAKLKPP